jgi:hypothetical protein
MFSTFERLQIVTPQLAEFMTLYPELNANCDLGNTSFSRVQVNRALCKYIKEHCSTAGPIIIPNKVISDLLDYPAYQEMVRRGEKTWLRKDPITRQMVQVVETNDRLTYAVAQHLLAKHFLRVDPLHLHCNHPSLIRHEEEDDDTDDPSD